MSIRDLLMGKSGKGETSAIADFNAVKLVGTVEAIEGDRALFLTKNTSQDGTVYEERHVVESDKLEVGKRYLIVGQLATVGEQGERETIIIALKATKAKKTDADQNIAKVVGRMAQSFQYFGRTEGGKVAFGNALMVTGPEDSPQFHRGVTFGNLANRLDREAKRGAIIQIVGPIRNRPYMQNGEEKVSVEVIGQPDLTKVLKPAQINDPFADVKLPDQAPATAEEAL